MTPSGRVLGVVLALGVAVVSIQEATARVQETATRDPVCADGCHRVRRQESEGLDWNIIFDGLIGQAISNIVAEGKDELSIPDIDENFEKKVGFVKLSGKFEARQGKVNSVSSIRRTGIVSFDGEPGQSVTLTVHLGFGTLRVRYDEYHANLLGARTGGRISASVQHNSVRLKARLGVTDTTCSLALEEATVVDLSGFDVNISGLGALDWLTSKIATWVANSRRDDIKRKLEDTLRKSLGKALDEFDCSKNFDTIRGLGLGG